jgi:hypothetical protein
MKHFFSLNFITASAIAFCFTGNVCAQDLAHPKYSGNLESLVYSIRSETNSHGKIFLSILLDEPHQIDWRIKKELKLLWQKEAYAICSTGPTHRETRYEYPVMSCDGPRPVPASMRHCGLIAGASGTFTCGPGSA